MSEIFNHPKLGELAPKRSDGILQFLGLKYASIKDRFASPELYSSSSSEIVDATHHGPSVITPAIGCEIEFGLIQQRLNAPEFKSSELEGLNLNITIPSSHTRKSPLPVFVFIHGGGFFIGGNSWPQYDLAHFVRLSVEDGNPIIAININYRLGVFGFLTSEELRNAGYSANNGLRDQQVAFSWIKENIAGFGGDPDNICVGGESAGGVSTTLHLYSKKPQFTRAVSLGGTSLLLKPLPPPVHEHTYETVLQKLGITEKTSEERISTLLTLPVEDILSKLPPGLPLHPMIDGDLIPVAVKFTDVVDPKSSVLPGKSWCKGLLIGDNQLDASIFIDAMERREGRLVDNFISSITQNLKPEKVAEDVLSRYGINRELSDESATTAILNFATDIGFHAPTVTFAKGWLSEAFVYSFNEPNPWEGRFKGHASHIIDVAFLFQNYNQVLNKGQTKSARAFASDIIKFINAKHPWKAFDDQTFPTRAYGPSDQHDDAVVIDAPGREQQLTARRLTIFEFVTDPGLDAISNAFGLFLAGQ